MAFEDRFSPQSAPSPPGVPHSPQNTTSASAMINCSTNSSFPIHQEMSLSTSNDRLSPALVIKQEDCSTNQITFSITNILSENFGKINKKCEKKNLLFRPYDIDSISNAKSQVNRTILNNKSTPLRLDSESALDFSKNNFLEKSNILNNFNQSVYPRIHEEILNSKKYQQHLSESAFSKIPPLGNLCKTVSQIGRQSTPSPVVRNDLLPSPVSSVSTGRSEGNGPQNSHQIVSSRDSGMESSDDAKSESGSTKDDNGSQLWPAWVYCTRYSDRPSSGKFKFFIFFC